MVEERRINHTLEALKDDFRKLGWDGRALDIISGWKNFRCTDQTFGFEMDAIDGTTTTVRLLVSNTRPEITRVLEIEEDGNNGFMSIKISPIDKIIATTYKGKGQSKSKGVEAVFIITRGGRYHYFFTGKGFVGISAGWGVRYLGD